MSAYAISDRALLRRAVVTARAGDYAAMADLADTAGALLDALESAERERDALRKVIQGVIR